MDNPSSIEEYRKLVVDTTINETTLLATDYLNHFNEVVMILGMLSDMPDMIDEALKWAPKSYQAHFADSVFPYRDLAITAFEVAPTEVRALFDPQIEEMNEMVIASVAEISAAHKNGYSAQLDYLVKTATRKLYDAIARAGAIINGNMAEEDTTPSEATIDQSAIDSLFD